MFQETRTIRIGGATKSELLDQLAQRSVQLNHYARELFADPDFVTSLPAREVTVAFVSLAEIGLSKGGRYDEILTHAAQAGLDRCPLELAPHLRLAYLDQPVGPYLTVASTERADDPETPNGFYLRHLDGQLWLRGYESGPQNVYAPDFSRFVFVHHFGE